MEILTGPEGRRWRTAEEKLEVVRASLEPGVVIADVARRFGVTRQQVYQWRSNFRSGLLQAPPVDAPVFAHVEVGGGGTTAPIEADMAAETVEIRLRNGRVLVVPATIERRRLQGLIRTVEAS